MCVCVCGVCVCVWCVCVVCVCVCVCGALVRSNFNVNFTLLTCAYIGIVTNIN